jgi:hypothetical protein
MRFDSQQFRMSQPSPVRYKRVVLKLSGEVLREPGSRDSIHPEIVARIATQVAEAQKLGVELMRTYCDPRGDFAWTPQTASEYITGTGDAARPKPSLQPSWTYVSTISSSTLRRWYASRPPILDRAASGEASRAVD